MPRKTETEKPKTGKPILKSLNESLGILFYLIWILIGLFIILFIVANFRQGAFRGLFSSSSQTQQPQAQTQTPEETTISGIGKVNIACVQQALTSAAISKIVQEGNTSSLTDDEKTKLEPCIVEKESATPSAIPGQ